MATVRPSDYMRGTAKFNATAAKYGEAAAIAQWQAAIDAERNQTPLDTSVLSIFTDQIITDPLDAPTDSLNNQLGKAFKNVFGKPWVAVLAIVIAAGLFLYFFGNPFKRRQA